MTTYYVAALRFQTGVFMLEDSPKVTKRYHYHYVHALCSVASTRPPYAEPAGKTVESTSSSTRLLYKLAYTRPPYAACMRDAGVSTSLTSTSMVYQHGVSTRLLYKHGVPTW